VLPKPEWTSALTCGGRHEQARLGATLAVTMRRVAAAAGLSLGALRENWPTRLAVSLLHETVEIVVGRAGHRAS
jgi:hypothetical protein